MSFIYPPTDTCDGPSFFFFFFPQGFSMDGWVKGNGVWMIGVEMEWNTYWFDL